MKRASVLQTEIFWTLAETLGYLQNKEVKFTKISKAKKNVNYILRFTQSTITSRKYILSTTSHHIFEKLLSHYKRNPMNSSVGFPSEYKFKKIQKMSLVITFFSFYFICQSYKYFTVNRNVNCELFIVFFVFLYILLTFQDKVWN